MLQDFGVKAWLGTLVVGPSIGVLGYLAITGSEAAVGALVALCSGVISYYFGYSTAQAQNKGGKW